MKKDTKIYWGLVIVVIIIIVVIFYTKGNNETPEEAIAKCIGENSVVYTQLGCSACIYQEKLFGENYQYINYIDCKIDTQECIDEQIIATPTWIIKGEKYPGVQSIEKLKELTGC